MPLCHSRIFRRHSRRLTVETRHATSLRWGKTTGYTAVSPAVMHLPSPAGLLLKLYLIIINPKKKSFKF